MRRRRDQPRACIHVSGTAPEHVPGTAPYVRDWLSEEHQLEEETERLMGEVSRAGNELGYCGNYNGEYSVSRGDTVYEVNPEDDDDFPVSTGWY